LNWRAELFKALLKKQLIELSSFIILDRKTGKKRTTGKSVMYILLYLVLFFTIGFTFFGMGTTLAEVAVSFDLDWFYFAFAGIITLMLGVFGDVFNTYSTVYRPKDNDLLLSMPIKPSMILTVRMFSVYLIGLLYEAAVMIPMSIAYWMNAEITPLRIILPILFLFILNFLVISITCVLGWIVAIVANKLKNKAIVTSVMTVGFIAIIYFLSFQMQNLAYTLSENIQGISSSIQTSVYPLYVMGKGVSGDIPFFLLFTLFCVLIAAITLYVMSRSFIKLATTSHSEKKNKYKEQTTKQNSIQNALVKKELLKFRSSSAYLLNSGLSLFILPVLGIVAVVMKSTINTTLGQAYAELPALQNAMPVIITAAVCLTAGMDTIAAPSVSLEGKNLWILKSMPIPTYEILLAKQQPHVILNSIASAVASILLGIAFNFDLPIIIFMIVCTSVFNMVTAKICILLGLKFAILSWTMEAIAIKQNIGTMLALFAALVLTLIIGGAYFAVMNKLTVNIYLIIVIAVLVLAARLLDRVIKTKGVALFNAL
jgi:ABC-2 type transport system permease protein